DPADSWGGVGLAGHVGRGYYAGCGQARNARPFRFVQTEPILMRRLAFRPMTVIGIMAVLAVCFGGAGAQPTAGDELTARIVVQLLEHDHMARPKINDDISKKWARNFLKDLDPQKNYFEKPDIDEFLAQDTTLDDKVRDGNLDFPRQVFARFLER